MIVVSYLINELANGIHRLHQGKGAHLIDAAQRGEPLPASAQSLSQQEDENEERIQISKEGSQGHDGVERRKPSFWKRWTGG